MSESKEEAFRQKDMDNLHKFFTFQETDTSRKRVHLFADDAVFKTGLAGPPEQAVGLEAIRKRFNMTVEYFQDYHYIKHRRQDSFDPGPQSDRIIEFRLKCDRSGIYFRLFRKMNIVLSYKLCHGFTYDLYL